MVSVLRPFLKPSHSVTIAFAPSNWTRSECMCATFFDFMLCVQRIAAPQDGLETAEHFSGNVRDRNLVRVHLDLDGQVTFNPRDWIQRDRLLHSSFPLPLLIGAESDANHRKQPTENPIR